MSILDSAILVIRESDAFSEVLRTEGAEVTNLPLIRTEPVDDQGRLHELMSRLNDYDGLFITSPAAAEIFGKELRPENEYRGKIYAMGERSREILERSGKPVVFDPEVTSAEELVRSHGPELDGKQFLFVRGDRSLETVPALLNGISNVDEVVIYKTVNIAPDRPQVDSIKRRISAGEFDWICFFSPSGVEAFCDLFENESPINAAVIGRTTARKAAEKGFDVNFVSKRPSDFATEFVSHLNGTQS